jgi:hypothetical protein
LLVEIQKKYAYLPIKSSDNTLIWFDYYYVLTYGVKIILWFTTYDVIMTKQEFLTKKLLGDIPPTVVENIKKLADI